MPKKEPKICPKCGEYYFGDACVGCHSNQYAHYNSDTSMKTKLLIVSAFILIVILIFIQK